MARIKEPTREEIENWNKWVSERPESVRKIAERFEPWSLYRLKSTGHRVFLYSFEENGTLTVVVSGKYNKVDFERKVFGIDPDDLKPCELPQEGDPLGAALTAEEARAMIRDLRDKK